MRKCGRSWWKPEEIVGPSVIKEVDASIFEDRSTGIPIQIYDRFPCVEKLELESLESVGKGKIFIDLIYKGKTYPCNLTKKVGRRDGRVSSTVVLYFDQDLIEVFKIELSETWDYIRKEKEAYETEKKERALQTGKTAKHYFEIPKEKSAYIEFYESQSCEQYEIKCIADSNYLESVENTREHTRDIDDEVGQYISHRMDVNRLCKCINRKGLSYSIPTISNFYLSLKTKPFTILTGISGTGKSKLVRLFAEAIGARFELIPVKPDWSDATDLLGYRDLNQVFHPGRFTQILKEAMANLDQPYIVCIDEMNLARVEYYFSDFLSLIESRRKEKDLIITDYFSGEDLEDFYIPENVYIVGTVNMDETTFQFSKKVLDRANTIELSEVDLTYNFEEEAQDEGAPLMLHNDALKSKYLVLRECGAHQEAVTQIINQLITLNNILKPSGLQFAYRMRDEIIFYMLYNKELGLLEETVAFDFQMLQKILPRISGTSTRVRDLLVKLSYYCLGETYSSNMPYEVEALEERLNEAIYSKSYEKLMDMLRRYDEDGFTSFWF